MKRAFVLLVVVMLIVASGCQPDAKTEARLRAVEARQDQLKESLLALSETVRDVTALTRGTFETNQAGIEAMRSNTLSALNIMWDLQTDLEAVRATNEILLGARARAMANAANNTRTMAPVYGLPPQAAQMRNGVPAATYQQIATDAERKWPGNFEMQAYEIKLQVEAYRKLHP